MLTQRACFFVATLISVAGVVLSSFERHAVAQTGCSAPGCYGPVQEESGFHEKGGYVAVEHNATVNHFGGHLIVSSEDISIPSIGGYSLHFRRTHSSAKTYTPLPWITDRNNSPLGIGWTSHYGVLWPSGVSGTLQPEFIDNGGNRELFYPHDTLSGSNGEIFNAKG